MKYPAKERDVRFRIECERAPRHWLDPFVSSLLVNFENLASTPVSILCCLILAFWSFNIPNILPSPSLSSLFPASHSDFFLKLKPG